MSVAQRVQVALSRADAQRQISEVVARTKAIRRAIARGPANDPMNTLF